MVRYLTTNDDNLIPGTIVCLEVSSREESDKLNPHNKIHSFRGWNAIAGRMEGGHWTREKRKSSVVAEEFWSWLNFVRRAERPVWIFTTAMTKSVTLLGLWNSIERGEFTLSLGPHPNAERCTNLKARTRMQRVRRGILMTGGPPTGIVAWHRDRWQLTIADLANYLDWPMRELAAQTDTQYCDYPDTNVPDELHMEACEGRCRTVRESVKRLIVWHNKQELGRFGLTISGIALAAFRHRFMRDKIELPEDQDERDWERTGYFNGRTQALWVGEVRNGTYLPVRHSGENKELFTPAPRGPFYLVDSRSFYGAISQFCELPVACTESHIHGDYPPPPTDESLLEVMATVRIESDARDYQCHHNGRCLYARGRIVTTLCGPELLAAHRAGDIRQWYGWRRYRLGQPLRWYSHGLWDQRVLADKSGDKLTAGICKSMLARLHGKFLQRATRWSILPGVHSDEPWSTWTDVDTSRRTATRYRSIGYDVQIQDDAGDSSHCFPAIPAWVTSHGRVWLRGWQEMSGGGNVLYVSTDSLIVTQSGYDRLAERGLVGDHGIGSLKVDKVSDSVIVRGPNNYELGGHKVLSGRPIRGLRVVNGEWFGEQQQGMEEIIAGKGGTVIATRQKCGMIRQTTALGTIGPGGWIQSPIITMQEEPCPPQPNHPLTPCPRIQQSSEWRVKDTSIYGVKFP